MTPRSRASQIEGVLRQHRGKDRAISSPEICRELGWKITLEREVRRLIKRESRSWGKEGELFLVCAVPGKGYFLAEDFDEVQAYRNWMSDQYMTLGRELKTFDQQCRILGIRLEKK